MFRSTSWDHSVICTMISKIRIKNDITGKYEPRRSTKYFDIETVYKNFIALDQNVKTKWHLQRNL